MPKKSLTRTLRETCQLTGARWALWLEHSGEFRITASYQLRAEEKQALLTHLNTGRLMHALERKLEQGRTSLRTRTTAARGAEGMYLFTDGLTRSTAVVGSEGLSRASLRAWKELVQNTPQMTRDASLGQAGQPQDGYRIQYYLPQALDQITTLVVQSIAGSWGWLAIRSGESLEVKSLVNCRTESPDRIPIDANPLLRGIMASLQGRIVLAGSPEADFVPPLGSEKPAKAWIGIPLRIGQRAIGLIGIGRRAGLSEEEWIRLVQRVDQMAPSVEASITFSDLTNHLHRLALLNDFAVTVSSALDADQIAQRMFALLQRAFNVEQIDLLVYSLDGTSFRHYACQGGTTTARSRPRSEIPLAWLTQAGEPGVRSGDVGPDQQPIHPGTQSFVVVPLRYRHQGIGLLSLESTRKAAFTIYDEHLLGVIASHLSGLLENSRLRRDAEEKARNLSLIHDVVERVIGLTDIYQVGKIAARLIAQNFSYELTVIVLSGDADPGQLTIAGIGGTAMNLVRDTLQKLDASQSSGIVSLVARTGETRLVNDVGEDPDYKPIPGWQAGSEMCVALKEGERILGVIDVESSRRNAFSHNDQIVLESLAGILASVFSNAEQYQKRQATIDQLQAARAELQERIAAQRMTESRLVQAAKLAAVGEMAAGIAHELNNPLTTVSGFTELVLQETSLSDGSRADLELILKEAHRARTVVRRLLDFARQSESDRAKSDINEVVHDALALIDHLLKTSEVELALELNRNIPWVMVDRNQLKQVILNLVHNALHAMPEGGTLRIGSSRRRREKAEWVVVSISDSGSGIPAQNLDRIFEPFFTTRSGDGGTGLGLSVSYGIISDHGGYIEVDSQEGAGSTFHIWLPIGEE